jgi:hypothetical protein
MARLRGAQRGDRGGDRGHRALPAGDLRVLHRLAFRDGGPGSKWLLVSACARGRSWRRWLCHQVHIDDFKAEADDSLYKPGEGSLVGQLGAECGRLRACGDLAVVELRAQRSAGLAAESDLIYR